MQQKLCTGKISYSYHTWSVAATQPAVNGSQFWYRAYITNPVKEAVETTTANPNMLKYRELGKLKGTDTLTSDL